MRARAICVLLAGASGCGSGTTDACDGVSGTCLGVHVVGSGAIAQVDQLEVHLSSAVLFDGRTPPQAGAAVDLPVRTAVVLPQAANGALGVQVVGFLNGRAEGAGSIQASIAPGEHLEVTVVLAAGALDAGTPDLADAAAADAAGDAALQYDMAGDAPIPDGGADFAMQQNDAAMQQDGAMPDLAAPDLAKPDLATPDLAMPDLAMPDLAMPDLVVRDLAMPDLVVGPRLIFLMTPTRTGSLGTLAGLDQACTVTAQQQLGVQWAAHAGSPYKAIISYQFSPPPVQRIVLGQGRAIVTPNNVQVADDNTLWNGNLTAPVNVAANGQVPFVNCAWTNTTSNGQIQGLNDCGNWTNGTVNASGAVGRPNAVGPAWLQFANDACSTFCAIYCIEQ